MALLTISAKVPSTVESAVSDLFETVLGCTPVIETKPNVGTSTISAYVARREWTRARKDALREALGSFGLKLSTRPLRHEDWAESWKRHFKPLEIGPTLLIKPSWSKRRPRKGQSMVVIDPGLSFGTGQHHTTRFCLEQLARCRQCGIKQSLHDIGTGSGILAIAAAKLGYSPVIAVDNDPAAIKVARRNARDNRVRIGLHIRAAGARKEGSFHIICANLTADILIEQSARIAAMLRPDGKLIAAGILKTEFKQVSNAFGSRGLQLVEGQAEGGWQSGVFRASAHG